MIKVKDKAIDCKSIIADNGHMDLQQKYHLKAKQILSFSIMAAENTPVQNLFMMANTTFWIDE